jgi:hypothetical protein
LNSKLSQQMTILGLCAMVFYAVMLATGVLSTEVMPQFVVSAVLFLSSGRFMRKAARSLPERERKEKQKSRTSEADWPWLAAIVNWIFALGILAGMAIWVMTPIGVSFLEALQHTLAHEQFFAGAVP